MKTARDTIRRIQSVTAEAGHRLQLRWSDGTSAEIDFKPLLQHAAFNPLRDDREFRSVLLGDWGHSLEWPCGVEIGADSLWLETLSATDQKDVRTFLEWRLRHGLSLAKAAEALGLSRRMVAYYSSGEKPIPRHIILACLGWEVASDPQHDHSTMEREVRELIPA